MEKYRGIVCLCIVMTCATVTVSADVSCFPHERDALLAFMNTSFDQSSVVLNSWNWKGFNCCEWSGPDLFQLKHLEYLDLSNNYFVGALPRELFGLQKLRHLDLSANIFQGEIPWQLGNLSQLQFLDLSRNMHYSSSLRWTVDTEPAGLKYLGLHDVVLNLTGEQLEASISHLHNLHHLDLSDCSLSGHIPNSIQNLTSLSLLHLGGNDFSSKIPSWLENMTTLVSLDLHSCHLSGPFPLFFSALPHLEKLSLSHNQLSGDASKILSCQWPHLTTFSVAHSSLTGSVPPCIGNISTLQHLDIWNNSLTGEIPLSLAQLPSLRYLDLSYNQLNGSIPTPINGLLPRMEMMDLTVD